MAASSGAVRMPGNPFFDQALLGERGRGKEARRMSFLTEQRRDSLWVSSKQRRVDWILKAGWSLFEPAPEDTFGYPNGNGAMSNLVLADCRLSGQLLSSFSGRLG
jgi:hypothetical protein